MYSVHGHGRMIADAVRTDAYHEALRARVSRESVVVDIGTGTGLFAMLACRLGARRVFAIESDDVIEVARRLAEENGFAERIEFFHAKSVDVDLPERADVIVSDINGVLPYFERNLVSLIDARERFLAPGGAMLPASETLWLALSSAPEDGHVDKPWNDNRYGLGMVAARDLAANHWRREVLDEGHLLSAPVLCAKIDYSTVDAVGLATSVEARASGAARIDGLCLWFDSQLAEGIAFSNAPGREGSIYGRAYFPWPEPIVLAAGERVRIDLRADLVRDEYIWTWDTSFPGRDGTPRFRQSDFFATPISREALRSRSPDHVAQLSEDGRIDALILELMGRALSLGEISRRLAAAFPARFAQWGDALPRVADLSQRYGR